MIGREEGQQRFSGGAAAPGESRFRRPSDVLLVVVGLRLAWAAQRVVDTPLPTLAARLARTRWLPRDVTPARAVCAASRACRLLRRLVGTRDTCLIRSLVAGALLADQDQVELCVGFRPGEEPSNPVDGHAWITMAGEPVAPDVGLADADYSELLRLPMRRRKAL